MDAEEKKSSDNDDNVMQGKEVEDIAVAKEEVKPVVSNNHNYCKNVESVVLSEQLLKEEDDLDNTELSVENQSVYYDEVTT